MVVSPVARVSLTELVDRINRRGAVESLTASVELQFEARDLSRQDAARRYRKADGRLIVARPQLIRLQVQLPLLKTTLAEMASDGLRFQLLIYPADHRAFIEGTTERDYSREVERLDADPALARAGPLVNVRPQHLVEPFLWPPVDAAESLLLLEEARIEEPDRRPRARKNARIVKSYHVVLVAGGVPPRLRSKYWFDRSFAEPPLTRRQSFDEEGRILSETRFSEHRTIPGLEEPLPLSVSMSRPYDAYSLHLALQPASVAVNRAIPESAFSLEAPEDWGDNVRRIRLPEQGAENPRR